MVSAAVIDELLAKVKQNLIITFDNDDDLIREKIRNAVDYAAHFTHTELTDDLKSLTEAAIIVLASHWYESRDASSGGYFGDRTDAAKQIMETVDNMLRMEKDWYF